MRLTVGEHSARYIQRIVRSHLRAWDLAELSDAVEPGATELVANVVRHVPDRHRVVLLLRQTSGVRVEVADGSLQLPLMPVELSLAGGAGRPRARTAGRGDQYQAPVSPDPAGPTSGVCGCRPGGKTVWFECRAECRGDDSG